MTAIDGMLLDFKRLDQLATGTTPLHRLDARAKVVAVLVYVLCVVSFGRYEISALLPFFIFPVFLLVRGNLPASYLIRKIGMVIPFALVVGGLNPVFDREVLFCLGPVAVSGGWATVMRSGSGSPTFSLPATRYTTCRCASMPPVPPDGTRSFPALAASSSATWRWPWRSSWHGNSAFSPHSPWSRLRPWRSADCAGTSGRRNR